MYVTKYGLQRFFFVLTNFVAYYRSYSPTKNLEKIAILIIVASIKSEQTELVSCEGQ